MEKPPLASRAFSRISETTKSSSFCTQTTSPFLDRDRSIITACWPKYLAQNTTELTPILEPLVESFSEFPSWESLPVETVRLSRPLRAMLSPKSNKIISYYFFSFFDFIKNCNINQKVIINVKREYKIGQ